MIFLQGYGNIRPNRILLVFLPGITFPFLFITKGFESIVEAIAREKFINGKKRNWKEELINKLNPEWKDLTFEIAMQLRKSAP